MAVVVDQMMWLKMVKPIRPIIRGIMSTWVRPRPVMPDLMTHSKALVLVSTLLRVMTPPK